MAGSRGLGHATAQALLQSGLRVTFCSRTNESLEEAARNLGNPPLARGLQADVTDPQALVGALDAAASDSPIDILVVNSGGPASGGFLSLDTEDWRRGYDTVVNSAVVAINCVLPSMLGRGFGRIIVIGSSSVRKPLPNLTLSNVFRPALAGLVKDLAVAHASSGVTVNMVSPGKIDTERVARLDAERARRMELDVPQYREQAQKEIPAGRYGTPNEFAAMVRFLASEEAGYITGQSVLIDGALTAGHP